MVYSQTVAFTWDEGFHLLAVQLIKSGKRPYIDFCFPQTPLNAYWNAAGCASSGTPGARPIAVAALATSAAILLTGGFLLTRLPLPGWRLAAALTAALTLGLNTIVLYYGTIGQAYGFCLLLIVGAFRVSMAVDRPVCFCRVWLGFSLSRGITFSTDCAHRSGAASVDPDL